MQSALENTHLVLVIGTPKAGKTQVFNLLSGKKEFENKPPKLVGPQVTAKAYSDRNIEIKFMDFGPNIKDDLIGVINQNLKSASKICLVFDISDADFLSTLRTYLTTSGIDLPPSSSILFVGTKADLVDNTTLKQRKKLADDYAQQHGGQCLVVSAKTKANFNSLAEKILSNLSEITPLRVLNTRATEARRKSMKEKDLAAALDEMDSEVTENGYLDDPNAFIKTILEAKPSELEQEHNQNLIAKIGSSIKRKPSVLDTSVHGNLVNSFREEPSTPYVTVRKKRKKKQPTIQLESSDTPPRNPPPSNDNYISFSLRIIGMALMLSALTSLIYLTIIAAGFLSSVTLTAAVNQIIVTVGGILGMSAPMATFNSLCAAFNVSTTLGSGIFATAASLITLGLGYGLRRLGQPSSASEERYPHFSFALRLTGMLLMTAALINLFYLLLIAAHILSAATMMATMNQILVTVGGLLGMSAPVASFANACAGVGLSATTVTGVFSATASIFMGRLGYGLFRRSQPGGESEKLDLTHEKGTPLVYK